MKTSHWLLVTTAACSQLQASEPWWKQIEVPKRLAWWEQIAKHKAEQAIAKNDVQSEVEDVISDHAEESKNSTSTPASNLIVTRESVDLERVEPKAVSVPKIDVAPQRMDIHSSVEKAPSPLRSESAPMASSARELDVEAPKVLASDVEQPLLKTTPIAETPEPRVLNQRFHDDLFRPDDEQNGFEKNGFEKNGVVEVKMMISQRGATSDVSVELKEEQQQPEAVLAKSSESIAERFTKVKQREVVSTTQKAYPRFTSVKVRPFKPTGLSPEPQLGEEVVVEKTDAGLKKRTGGLARVFKSISKGWLKLTMRERRQIKDAPDASWDQSVISKITVEPKETKRSKKFFSPRRLRRLRG